MASPGAGDDLSYVRNETSAALLRAARSEFAEHGIAGGRIDRIAKNAGVNKERIYAYFGSKERLFDVAVADALAELVDVIALRPGDDLGDYVLQVIAHHRASPELSRLMLWESLHYGGGDLPASGSRAALYRAKLDSMMAVLGTDDPAKAASVLHAIIGVALWGSNGAPFARLLALSAGVGDFSSEFESLVGAMFGSLAGPKALT